MTLSDIYYPEPETDIPPYKAGEYPNLFPPGAALTISGPDLLPIDLLPVARLGFDDQRDGTRNGKPGLGGTAPDFRYRMMTEAYERGYNHPDARRCAEARRRKAEADEAARRKRINQARKRGSPDG